MSSEESFKISFGDQEYRMTLEGSTTQTKPIVDDGEDNLVGDEYDCIEGSSINEYFQNTSLKFSDFIKSSNLECNTNLGNANSIPKIYGVGMDGDHEEEYIYEEDSHLSSIIMDLLADRANV